MKALDSEHRGRRYVKNMGHNRNHLYSRSIHSPTSMFSQNAAIVPLFQQDGELQILDPVACVIAFKLHGEGTRGSQALSIAL